MAGNGEKWNGIFMRNSKQSKMKWVDIIQTQIFTSVNEISWEESCRHIIFTFNSSWFLLLFLKYLELNMIRTLFSLNSRFVWLNSPKVCDELTTCESYISDSGCRVPVMPFFDPTSTSLVWLRRTQFITCTVYPLSVMTNDASSLLCSIAMTF